MTPFSWLRTKHKNPKTVLQEFIEDKCGARGADNIFANNPNKKTGFATSLSVTILSFSGKFIDELRRIYPKLDEEFPGKMGWQTYDIVAFEAAAWCHFYLLRDYLKDADSDDDEDSSDVYTECLRESVLYTDRFLKKFIGTQNLPDDFFIVRVYSYGLTGWEGFLKHLVASLVHGIPERRSRLEIGDGLFLTIALTAHIATFTTNSLDRLEQGAKEIYKKEVSTFL